MFTDLTIDVFGCTDIGRVRKTNEDQYLVAELHKVANIKATSLPDRHVRKMDGGVRGLLLMVADGVGGHPGGREASALAIETIVKYATDSLRSFHRFDDGLEEDLMHELAQSVYLSHEAIVSRAEREPWLSQMQTTLTKVHVLWPTAYLVQVGDSRCYRLGADHIECLTTDQTVAQHLIDWGDLTPEDARATRWSRMLTESVGGSSRPHPTISKVSLERGDALLLCSDGLTRHVAEAEIHAVVDRYSSAKHACEELVAMALDAGGQDNVTVVLCRFG